jgi:alpha 1,2-mannosyltransferase
MLARNIDVGGAMNAVREMEDRFNHNFNYPWVFLNDEPFSDEFKQYVVGPLSENLCSSSDTHQSRVSNLVSGPAHFGQVPEEHWHQPPWIDETKAEEERRKMIMEGIPYSDSVSCGFSLFLFFLWVFLIMGRMHPDIAICADSTLGCDMPLLVLPSRIRTDGA